MKSVPKFILAALIAAAGVAIAAGLVMSKPKAEKVERPKVLPAVEVVTAQTSEFPVTVATQGEVMARKETVISAEVAGRVISISDRFEVGETFEAGDVLLGIDPADYQAAAAMAASEVEAARLKIATEEALAKQAQRDWEALGKGREPTDLVLRKPQLASARAALAAAQAAVEKAGRDLERTNVRAPYACRVSATQIELGAVVAAGAPLASVFSTGEYELRLPVSLEDYAFVDVAAGVPVAFEAELGGQPVRWQGELIRMEGQVDRASRSVFLVAKVAAPGDGSDADKFLAPGLFLQAKVSGKTLEGVFRLPRKALYGKDEILIVNPDDTVSLRPVKVVRTEVDEVVIGGGLEAGERVAISPLPNVIDGMEVEVLSQEDTPVDDGSQNRKEETRDRYKGDRSFCFVMGGLIHWFSRNHVAANFVMGAVLLAGITTWLTLKKEIFPETETDVVAVRIPYPGATPEEVEKGVCIPIEEAVQDIEGIESLKSTSVDSLGVVIIEVASGFELRDVLDDVKSRVDAIENLAENAETPVYEEILIKSQVLTIAVSAQADEKTLRGFAEQIRDGLLVYQPPPPRGLGILASLFRKDKGISQVALEGVRPYEISIEVSEDDLRAYGLTLGQVADAVRASSLDLPGGSVRTEAGEVLIKAEAKRYDAEGFEQLPLITKPDGTEVLLGDVATVVDGFEDVDLSSRFDGRRAATIQVFRIGDEDTLAVAGAAKNYLEEVRQQLPDGVQVEIWNDTSKMLEGRMNLLAKNGLTGLILVLIVLSLFLRPSLAALVTIGIPVSFAGAIWMMPYTAISVNMITLFAFILVLGIVVDDAIVVGENVYRRIRAGEDPREASWKGTHEVGVVVIFGVLTTAVAFTPMLGISGVSGKIWRNIPWIVIPTLLFSLVQSKLILPAHLAFLRPADPNTEHGPILRLQRKVAHGLEYFVDHYYRPVLRRALDGRVVVLAIFFALFATSVGLVAGGRLKWEFFPEVEAEIIAAKLAMVDGVAFEETSRAVARIEAAAKKLNERYTTDPDKPLVRHMLASVGSQPFKTGFSPVTPRGGNLGEVALELPPGADRDVTAKALAAEWRELTGPIAGVSEVSFQSQAAGGGNAIDLELTGDDFEQLRAATEYVKEKLAEIDGIIDINDGDRFGKREILLEDVLPAGEASGIRLADVARQMRHAFYGDEAQRLQRGRDEVKVMVRYPKSERVSEENIEQMKVRTQTGDEVPLSAVVEFGRGRGSASVQRTDRMRTIRIAADIDVSNPDANANEARRTLEEETLKWLEEKFPGVKYQFQGEQKDQQQSMEEMGVGFLFALAAMFVLMAIPLRSYVQPMIVMCVIPFGFVGAVAGHMLMGVNLNIMSMCGIVALAGVVVNDSLVLVDYVNRHRASGQSVIEAAWAAGAARFRPILLTSLTTFAGLTPMLLETDLQAKFLIPMAISLGFGILFATCITLFLVPCVYLTLEDVKGWIFTKETLKKWDERLQQREKEENHDHSKFAL